MTVYQVINSKGYVAFQSTHYGEALHQSRLLGYRLIKANVSMLSYLYTKLF